MKIFNNLKQGVKTALYLTTVLSTPLILSAAEFLDIDKETDNLEPVTLMGDKTPTEEMFEFGDESMENIIAEELYGTDAEDVRCPLFDLDSIIIPSNSCIDPLLRDSELDFRINLASYRTKRTGPDYGDGGAQANTTALAPTLSYRTGYWQNCLQFGAMVTTDVKLHAGSTPNITPDKSLLKNGYENFTSLRRCYITGKVEDNLRATVGRQGVNMPFIGSGPDTSFLQSDYTAVIAESEDFPICGLKLMGGYFFQMRTGSNALQGRAMDFTSMSEAAYNNSHGNSPTIDVQRRGVASIAGSYEPCEDFNMGFAYHHGFDTMDILYADAGMTFEYGPFEISPAVQAAYQGSNKKAFADVFNATMVGAKVDVEYCGFQAGIAYTQTITRADPLQDYWGNYPGYTSMILSDFSSGGEKAVSFGLGYDFSYMGLKGLNMSGNYTYGHKPNPQLGERELDLTIDYICPEPMLEGLWLRFRAARQEDSKFFKPEAGGNRRIDLRFFVYYTKAIF